MRGFFMKIAICDDEDVFRQTIIEYLQPYIEKNPEITECEFCCGDDLVAAYEQGNTYDILFLDIEMPGISGVEAGKRIREMDHTALFIFITSHTEFVPEAFMLNAFQFLAKPVKQDLFVKEFDRAVSSYKKMKFKYHIIVKNKTTILEVKDIMYIETYNRNLRAVTLTDSYEFTANLATEETKLEEYDFVRCHQGYLVNLKYVFRPEHSTLTLTNQAVIPIGKRYKNDVLTKLNKYISGCCI